MWQKLTIHHFLSLISLAALVVLLSWPSGEVAAQEGVDIGTEALQGTAFTYQGQLKRSGSAYNGACDFQFSLYNAASGGAQVGSTQNVNSVTIVNGLFTVQLDFGNQFTGDARWLQTAVKCSGDGGFTTLNPRQLLTATPYALGLRPGALVNGSIPSGSTIQVINASGIGVNGSGGVRAGVLGTTTDINGSGVEGNASGSNAAGVFGVNTVGPGVWGRGTSGGRGVFGESASGLGVYGVTTSGLGVYGLSSTNGGVFGVGYVGVQGNTNGTTDSQGVRGDNGGSNTVGYAGLFNGRVSVFGNLNVYGTLAKAAGAFRIDHPLDPANKYLNHSFVESPDMKNIYDGIATLDSKGEALVKLPDWFEALNQDFRYQLTCIGGYAPVYIAQQIANNQFKIAGGTPGLKVSWQITGIRHDPYANANRIPVEEDKPAQEKGTYLYPELYGLPREKGLTNLPPASAPPGATLPDQSQPTR